MYKIKNGSQGFTLLELLVVILIIGILAAIALPQYRKAVAKAELAQIVSATKSLKQAQERFYLTNNRYSGDIEELDITVNNPNISCKLMSNSKSVVCNNKNFALWVFVNHNGAECATKNTDENSPLVDACKNLLNTDNCRLDSTASSCNRLGISPCYLCTSSKFF